MKPDLFYTTTEKCEQGDILWVEADIHHPEFFICHPLDFDEINEKITEKKLISVDSYLISDISMQKIDADVKRDGDLEGQIMISIITPVWNRSDLTHRWLYQNWAIFAGHSGVEWIVVDNGSTDDTVEVLEHWRNAMGDCLKIISLKENTGFGPANNRGAEIATGDILAFISNDVQVLGDYITPIEVFYRYDQGPILVGPEIWDQDTGWNTFDLGTIPYVAGWCVVVEAALWGPLCKWDERFVPCDYEDIDLSYQVARGGGKLTKLDLPLKHDSGQSAAALPGGRLAVTMANQKRFMEKWGLKFA